MERLTRKTEEEFAKNNGIHYLANATSKKILNKLGEYEDAEEQGLLLRFPCKVGDTVWAITSPINLGFDEGETLEVYKCVVESISFYNNRKHQIRLYSGGVFVTWYVRVSDFGKTVFLTEEEAEQALAKMEK